MTKKYIGYLLIAIMLTTLLNGCAASTGEETNQNADGEEAEQITNEDGTKTDFVQETENLLSSGNGNSVQITFEGQDMEGNAVSSAIFSESKLTMVNVWATYCNPCLSEMPGLGKLAAEYDTEEFRIVGIISDVPEGAAQETMDLAADLIEQTGADYTHLPLNESLYNALLTDVTAVPTTFFINQDGVILDMVIGAMEESAWEEKINALLEEQ